MTALRYYNDLISRGISTPAFGAISADSNSTATTISSSSSDFSNKVQVTIFDTNDESSFTTPDHTNDHIEIEVDGVYLITACTSMSGGINATISFAIFKNNGATKIGTRATRVLSASGDVGSATTQALVSLVDGDTIELWVQNETNTNNVTFEDCRLSVIKVK